MDRKSLTPKEFYNTAQGRVCAPWVISL